MSSSATVSASVCTAASRGAFIELPPVPVISVLALRHAHDQPVERLADLELAGEAGGGVGARGKTQHARFLRSRGGRARNAHPPPLPTDMARGRRAPPAPLRRPTPDGL